MVLKVFILVFLLEIKGIGFHGAFGLSLRVFPTGEFPFIGLLSEYTCVHLGQQL